MRAAGRARPHARTHLQRREAVQSHDVGRGLLLTGVLARGRVRVGQCGFQRPALRFTHHTPQQEGRDGEHEGVAT